MSPLAMVGKVWKLIITSAAVGLFVTLLTAALTTYGVVSVSAARWMLFFAWLVLVGGISTSDYLCDKKVAHVLIVGLISACIVGGFLIWIDHWAISTKAALDARSVPPPLAKELTRPPVPPKIAYLKTPLKPSGSKNIVTGNQNVTGNTVIGNNNVLGNNNTVQIDTKDEWKLTDNQKQDLRTELSALPGPVEVEIVVESGSDNANEFASELVRDVFNLPGWKIGSFHQQVPPIAPGITIESPIEYNPPASVIQKKLQMIFGQQIPGMLSGTPPPNGYVFTLFIRRKKGSEQEFVETQ